MTGEAEFSRVCRTLSRATGEARTDESTASVEIDSNSGYMACGDLSVECDSERKDGGSLRGIFNLRNQSGGFNPLLEERGDCFVKLEGSVTR